MEQPQRKQRTLIYDIETSPIISYNWGIWEQNAIKVIQDWQIICFAYKWLGERKIHFVAQWQFKGHKNGVRNLNDKHVVNELWELFNEADIVVAHNGDSFDQKKSQARMMIHKLSPPAPYKQIDTKKVAKRYGAFTSNKLDDLGNYLGGGRKEQTGGFSLWEGCMDGESKAQRKMEKYNRMDVQRLEELYLSLRPWITTHPAMNVLTSRPDACPKCAEIDTMIKSMKYKATSGNKYQTTGVKTVAVCRSQEFQKIK